MFQLLGKIPKNVLASNVLTVNQKAPTVSAPVYFALPNNRFNSTEAKPALTSEGKNIYLLIVNVFL